MGYSWRPTPGEPAELAIEGRFGGGGFGEWAFLVEGIADKPERLPPKKHAGKAWADFAGLLSARTLLTIDSKKAKSTPPAMPRAKP
jgi:hypothetical protein